jgi:hypothetical protein
MGKMDSMTTKDYESPSDKSHDQSQCGGTWRAHSDLDERRACIKLNESLPRWWERSKK